MKNSLTRFTIISLYAFLIASATPETKAAATEGSTACHMTGDVPTIMDGRRPAWAPGTGSFSAF